MDCVYYDAGVMRIPSPSVLLAAIMVVLASSPVRGDMADLLGKWRVDVPATVEAGKQSPKFKPEDHDKMAAMIERMLGSMSLTLDEANVIFARGTKFMQSRAYTLKSDVDGVTTVTVLEGEKPVELAFTLEGDNRMRLKSSASTDMDFYVWTRAAGETGESPTELDVLAAAVGGGVKAKSSVNTLLPTISQNLATILNGARQYALETGKNEVTYETLATDGYFKPLQPVNGEDYSTVSIDLKAGTVSVKDGAGVVHTAR